SAAFLALYDVAAGWAVRGPAPEKVVSFFEYGESIEAKLRRMVGLTSTPALPFAPVGFLEPGPGGDLPAAPEPGDDLLVASYGMSFSNDVTQALTEVAPAITARFVAAPSAPASHAYAAYTVDRGRHKADVVILGVLASSVPGLLTHGLTWYFVSPY